VYHNLIEGIFDYKTSASVFLELYLDYTGDTGFQYISSILPHDWLHRVVNLLRVHDGDYVGVVNGATHIDKAQVFMQFKSFFLLLQRISHCKNGVSALQDSHLVEILSICHFPVTSPSSETGSFIDLDSSRYFSSNQQSQDMYFQLLLPVLQLLITLLVVDRDDDRNLHTPGSKFVHNSSLHAQISKLLSEHSEGLVVPILERRLVSLQALLAVDSLFEMRLLSEGPVGLEKSSKNIIFRSGALFNQILANYIALSHELNENPDLRVDMELFSGNAVERSDTLDALCSIICNLTSILITEDYLRKLIPLESLACS
jgi:hypothetical protein